MNAFFSRIANYGRSALQIIEAPPSLETPVSQACTQAQMERPVYHKWCEAIGEVPRLHRKQWEFCYIIQTLDQAGMLAPGKRGLGFGVGGEPLTAYFASRGVEVLATDLDTASAEAAGWIETGQHSRGKAQLNDRGLCDPERFDQLVQFRILDMNQIPNELHDSFDFCWSACALEHLGSINNGLDFIVNSIKCLHQGGLAVHTTELNCSSNRWTLDNTSTVLFRRRDMISLAKRAKKAVEPMTFNFDLGDRPLDHHADVPPYSEDRHLKMQLDEWVTTSFGLVMRKRRGA